MTILITAASGQLGGLVVDAILDRGVAPERVIATARDTAKLSHFSDRGVRTAPLDYDDPATIAAALDGVESVLLVSSNAVGGRVDGHRNVITAAKDAGVSKLVYTSAPNATTADFVMAPDHKATEEAITSSGVPAVILRNNWYTENYIDTVRQAAQTSTIVASAGDGRVASASRADFAAAAATVLIEDGHLGQVYELAGDVAWNFTELADAASQLLGREVTYSALSYDEHVQSLQEAGLDDGTANFVAAIDDGIRRGVLAGTDGTLARLIGRPTTPLIEGLRTALER
ncbi:SDR family oxidoreductase [Cumulibacter soli]|uniref:SDR family oxidoreductase n=1 Tax=Cumulibacter soli TaxID=2546344 RepID=UPI0010678A00|nr:SDR family oxidoreductase [Cumulibacter soli]